MKTSERFNHPSRFLIVGVTALGLTMAVVPDEAGHKALRPYSADYFFYRSAE
jgi:hypothetical protein